jgi:hypothetical protein
MNMRAAVSLAASVFALSTITLVASTASPAMPSAQSSAAASSSAKMLDAIPAALFHKMFQSHKLVGSPGLAWKKQRIVTVAFNGGSEDLYQLIEQTASEWTELGGQLSFSFKDASGKYRRWTADDTTPAANIRIAFDATGYWSLLGAMAKNVDPGDSTMNFEGFPDELKPYFHGQNADVWRTTYAHTTILHEFGHSLGLSHEHFNPQCQKDLKLDTILAYLEGPPNNWSPEQARFNIDAKYYVQILAQQAGLLESKLINSPTADQSSVMLYVFPSSYYNTGDRSVCKPIGDHGQAWPTVLSDGDKQFYLANYKVIQSPFGPAHPAQSKQK